MSMSSPSYSASQRQGFAQSSQINYNEPCAYSHQTPQNLARPLAVQSRATDLEHHANTHQHNPATAPPPMVQGIQLVPVQNLPYRFRSMFPFSYFNAVQSKVFQDVFNTQDNVVLSAPTGSGKTAVFELAICQLADRMSSGTFKAVYMCPTKALCAERQRDWADKFKKINLTVKEMTGDTDSDSLDAVKQADIIVTNPEKWDMMTRKWKDHQRLVELIRLFMIDEVHILGKDRGAVLEAVVSRMKSVGSDIRFVAVSATVPNSGDIATWLGRSSTLTDRPAVRHVLGESFRPVKLTKHVCGYQFNGSEFAFDSVLNKK